MNPNDPRIEALYEFLRFPSVSTQSEHTPDLVACAEWVHEKLTSLGLESTIHPTGGQPVVVARSVPDPDKRTVLIYGHYDVQPAEPLDLWLSPPFVPTLRDDRIYARGSTDNKGQILAHILGVGETLARDGTLPVNVIFLIEGEEEIGSPNLEAFLLAHRSDLACDVIALSDNGMVADFFPTLSYAMRGIAAMEVRVTGPSVDLHSGVYGGAVMNPATATARLAASLHDSDGRVLIPGFYDDVLAMHDWERAAAAASPVTDDDILAQTGSPALFGEAGYNSVERIGARPTAEVNGIGGGYQGEGTKTVLPASAFLKLTFRLVANQDPATILDLAETYLRAQCPPGVSLEIVRGHSGEPYFTDPMSPDGRAAQAALREVFERDPALHREGGSIPILSSFKKVLGADSLLPALASPDCAAHSPNENFPVRNFLAGITLNQILLAELARVPRTGIHGYRGDVPDLTATSHTA